MLLWACETEKKKELPFSSKEEYEQTIIESHQAFLKKEKRRIDEFVTEMNRLGIQFKATGTGLRYGIYEESDGDSLKSGDFAYINYVLTNLEGDTIYQSPQGKIQEFAVDYDNVESGLHEGIKQLRVGEKAYLILPTHLAHGITGDQINIPPQTTLVYNLHLVAKK